MCTFNFQGQSWKVEVTEGKYIDKIVKTLETKLKMYHHQIALMPTVGLILKFRGQRLFWSALGSDKLCIAVLI